MAVRGIRTFGDPVLRQPAQAVADFDSSLGRLVADLSETLADAGGAGLAAPQIGVGLRVFVYGVTDQTSAHVGVIEHIVNPVLVDQDEMQIEDEEGCLSIPGLVYQLARSRLGVPARCAAHAQ